MTVGQVNIPYQQTPAHLVNLAIDALGQPGKIIGDLTDGTPVAETARRNYGLILRGLLRTAHWTFARKQASLQLLGDSSGQSAAPVVSYVDPPWTYAYAWPPDAVAARWMPASVPMNTISAPATPIGTPLTTASGPTPPIPLLPARFLVTMSEQYPVLAQQPVSWQAFPDLQRTEGLGLTRRKIILTDNQNSLFVYTALVTEIEMWDDLFRQAMVSLLATVLAPVAIEDVKLRVTERDKHSAMAKMAIADARVANGQDAGFPQSVDHTPAWIKWRKGGAYGGAWNTGVGSGYGGGLYAPWEPFSLGSSVY